MSYSRISCFVLTSLILLVSGVGANTPVDWNLPVIETLESAAIESENGHSVSKNSVTPDMIAGVSVSTRDKRTGDSRDYELAGLFSTIHPHAQLDYPPLFEKCSFPADFSGFSGNRITWSVIDSDSSLENHSPGKPYSRYLLPLLLTFAAAGVTYALFVVRSH